MLETAESPRTCITVRKAVVLMSIEDFVSNRWSDAKEALRKLDPDFVDRLDSLARLERMQLYMPPDWIGTEHQIPKKRLSKEWHDLLEACFELIIQARDYRTAISNMASETSRGLSDLEVGKQFAYNFRVWALYQHAIVEHVKTVISFAVKIYPSGKESRNQLKKRHHRKADTLKERIEADRQAIVHGGGLTSQELTKDQWWEGGVAIGMLPGHVLDEFVYEESGRAIKAGRYDAMLPPSRLFLDALAKVLHDFEDAIARPPNGPLT